MSRERSALLVLNGPMPDAVLVRRAARRVRRVLCADGGLRAALKLGLNPDIVVGDMDSLPRPLPRLRKATFCCDFDQDRSDFDKALALAADMGCRKLYVAGALGGRPDHAAVNLALAERWSDALALVLLDRGAGRVLGPGDWTFALGRAEFSLVACSPFCRLSVSGARYPLENFRLEPGGRGLSNRAAGPVQVKIKEGKAWIWSEKGAAALL